MPPRRGDAGRSPCVEADALQLPFTDGRFDIVCVAFGLRNLSDTRRRAAGDGPRLPARRTGGGAGVLHPPRRPLAAVYDWYFRRVLPRVGQTLAQNRQGAYNYLPASVGQFPQGEAMVERMRAAGLEEVCRRAFTLGVCTLYTGRKTSLVGLRGDAS